MGLVTSGHISYIWILEGKQVSSGQMTMHLVTCGQVSHRPGGQISYESDFLAMAVNYLVYC